MEFTHHGSAIVELKTVDTQWLGSLASDIPSVHDGLVVIFDKKHDCTRTMIGLT